MARVKIDSRVEGALKTAWNELKDQMPEDEFPVAKQVLAHVESQPEEFGVQGLQLPKLRKAQLILEPLKPKFKDSSPEQKNLDKAWSMGTLENCPLSPDALIAVLRMWRYCQLAGFHFSIRKARWVAWLHPVAKAAELDRTQLFRWASYYSEAERNFKMSGNGEDFNTADIDAGLVMGAWELLTARWTGSAEWNLERIPDERHLSCKNPLVFISDRDIDIVVIQADLFIRDKWKFSEKCNEMSEDIIKSLNQQASVEWTLGAFKVSQEAKLVYAHWMRYLAKGPNLDNLSLEELRQLILGLRQWITEHPWNTGILGHSCDAYALLRKDPDTFAREPSFMPRELLKTVGYDVLTEGGAK